MFGPLEFLEQTSNSKSENESHSSQELVPCILCEKQFHFPKEQEECLSHIYEFHHLIISDVEKIPQLPKYLGFWRAQFSHSDIKTYCSTLLVDVLREGVLSKDEEFFLLSDILPLDKEFRETLCQEQLEAALEQQKFEREDKAFKRGCLFCRNEIGPTRAEFLNHLSTKHNLQLGRTDNLVYIDKMIVTIEAKLENLQCVYCEKFFKDRNVLKEHMRKKLHKRINPKNKLYDQFYIINYLDPNKSLKQVERDGGSSEEECDWSDWKENLELSLVCLFCPKSSSSWQAIHCHMDTEHHFQYEKNASGFCFYDQVKLVNYIRRQVYKNRCICCNAQQSNNVALLEHMEEVKHLVMPHKDLWNQPEFYFPTYENDAFLCQLDDQQNSESELSDAMCEMSVNNSSDVFTAV